jgi:hypothetical protein
VDSAVGPDDKEQSPEVVVKEAVSKHLEIDPTAEMDKKSDFPLQD